MMQETRDYEYQQETLALLKLLLLSEQSLQSEELTLDQAFED